LSFPFYGKQVFFRINKEWYHFQQKLMVSKMVVYIFIISLALGLQSVLIQ